MIRFFIFLVPFLREMIFGKADEEQRQYVISKTKRIILFSVLLVSLFLNFVSINKLYTISLSHIHISKELAKLKEIEKEVNVCRIKQAQLENIINTCIEKGKK